MHAKYLYSRILNRAFVGTILERRRAWPSYLIRQDSEA